MSGITTHVLDTSRGRPAQGVPVTLEIEAAGGWKLVGKGTSNRLLTLHRSSDELLHHALGILVGDGILVEPLA